MTILGTSRQLPKVTLWIFRPNHRFHIKTLFCKVADLAKIKEPSWTTPPSQTNSLASNFGKCRENWHLAPKSITKGVPHPQLLVASKIRGVHLPTPDPTEKKSGQPPPPTRTTLWELPVAQNLKVPFFSYKLRQKIIVILKPDTRRVSYCQDHHRLLEL